MDGWANNALVGLIELKDGVKPKDLDGPMRDLIHKNAPEQTDANLKPFLVPLKTYYITANNGLVKNMLYTLSIIAFFILAMAVINFVNICIGRSSQRLREMGIRKVLGGLRKQLIWQFLIESTLTVMIATLIALGFYTLARPIFADLLNTEITGLFAFPWWFYLFPVLLSLIIGLLAGLYPALVLSSLRSVDSLKGKLSQVKDNVIFRKVLVGFQFATAALVLFGAIIISKQIGLFFGNSLGYDKDYVVYAQLPRDWSKRGVQKMEVISAQLAQMPQVSSVALSWEIPDGSNGFSWQIYKPGTGSTHSFTSQVLVSDNQYARTYDIPIKAGVFFGPNFMPADSGKIVINQSQAKALGYNDPKDAIGQQVKAQGLSTPLTICGVTGNFQFGSMQGQIQPITFINVNWNFGYRYFSIKLKPADLEASLTALQKKWSELLPGAPFEYNFMDDALKKLYKTEIQLKKASFTATILAIIIALLGVIGLISLSLQKRTKEIGIRKVLGSSVKDVIMLFLKDFLGTVIIACLVACPLAYLIMHKWLNGYAQKISITAAPFLVVVVSLTAVTAFLISLQTIKAALDNPIKSLRTE